MEQHTHTIVVGAGITGLAYCLMHGQTHVNKDRRPSLLLLEKEFEVGGRIRSFQQNLQSGQYIELGPARFNQDHTNLILLGWNIACVQQRDGKSDVSPILKNK